MRRENRFAFEMRRSHIIARFSIRRHITRVVTSLSLSAHTFKKIIFCLQYAENKIKLLIFSRLSPLLSDSFDFTNAQIYSLSLDIMPGNDYRIIISFWLFDFFHTENLCVYEARHTHTHTMCSFRHPLFCVAA